MQRRPVPLKWSAGHDTAPALTCMPAGLATSDLPTENIFLVEGEGDFPLDLLRQERCWPARPQDGRAIAIGMRDAVGPTYRQVALATHNPKAPSERRWRNKGWIIII